jgi:hypothetical protein
MSCQLLVPAGEIAKSTLVIVAPGLALAVAVSATIPRRHVQVEEFVAGTLSVTVGAFGSAAEVAAPNAARWLSFVPVRAAGGRAGVFVVVVVLTVFVVEVLVVVLVVLVLLELLEVVVELVSLAGGLAAGAAADITMVTTPTAINTRRIRDKLSAGFTGSSRIAIGAPTSGPMRPGPRTRSAAQVPSRCGS